MAHKRLDSFKSHKTLDVDGTTSAVVDVTTQIRHVDSEVSGTRSMAKNVESVCFDVAEDVKILQKTLVEIVRTCSAEVDRRSSKRTTMDTVGTIEANGSFSKVTVVDMSEGGVKLAADVDPRLRNFTLRVAGFQWPLNAQVVTSGDGWVHASFNVDEEMTGRIRSFLKHVEFAQNGRSDVRLSA